MKQVLISSILVLSTLAQAGLNISPIPSRQKVSEVKSQVAEVVESVPGVNGHGITACDSETGVPFFEMSEKQQKTNLFVHCITINAETDEALEFLREIYPLGKLYKGIYIVTKKVGKVVIH